MTAARMNGSYSTQADLTPKRSPWTPQRLPRGVAQSPVVARLVLLLLSALMTSACKQTPADDAPWTTAERRLLSSLAALPAAPPPSPGNRVADNEAAASLGHALFFDTRLSSNGQVACATCHQPQHYFTDGLRVSKGVGEVTRNAPTLIGAQSLPFLFHDGRKDSVWSQALGPLEAAPEHGFDRAAVAHVVAAHYRAPYEAIFGPLPPLSDTTRFPAHARPVPLEESHPHHVAWVAMLPDDQTAVNTVFANVGKALEAYQRKLWPQPAPFDAYVHALERNDAAAAATYPEPARRGLRAFVGKAQCVNCHNGPLFTDGGFHNVGAPPPSADKTRIDIGRSQGAQQVKQDEFRCGSKWSDATKCDELRFLNPKFEDFLGAFKTPTLRNVAQTAPYFHAGQFATLDEVLTFYRSLPGQPQIGHRELVLSLLDPSLSQADLLAFLHTLTGPLPEARWLSPPK